MSEVLPERPVFGEAAERGRREGSAGVEPVITHLAVSGSREMLLDEPQSCPAYPGMTLDGLAVAPDGVQHFLVVTVRPPTKATFRMYIGPDPQRVARRGLIVVAGLRSHGGLLAEPALGISVLTWLAACWSEAATEIDRAVQAGR